jgi:ketosteroid isomerase-like protein
MPSPEDIEQQFYEALQQADIDKLMAVWSDEDEIACIHPGGPRLVGAAAIRTAFDAMFANGRVDACVERVRRVQMNGASVHHVLERVQVPTDEGARTAWVLATNVYLKTEQGWRMVLHHASPGSVRDMQEISEAPSTLH